MNLLAAILYAVASSVLLGVALGFWHGGLDATMAALALGGGALIGLVSLRRGCAVPLPRPRGWQWLPVVLFGIFAVRAFLWLVFEEKGELRVLSPNNLGDLSLHLTFIHTLANGAPFWPDNPIFANGKLAYAVGMDLFNSLLTLVGVDVLGGLIWAGLTGAILTGFALWRWGGAFTLMGFLCNGGLLAFAAFTAGGNEAIFQDYAGNLKFDWAWKSLPLSILVTQRGFLFALPAGLLLLTSWRTRWLREDDGWRLPFAGELLLYAAMPVFHVHTFLALSLMLAAFWVARRTQRRSIATLVAAAFVPATVLVWLTVGMFKANAEPTWSDMSQLDHPPKRAPIEALGWQPGWMVNDETVSAAWEHAAAAAPALRALEPHGRFLFFWLGNFGVLPLLAGALGVALFRQLWPPGPRAVWAWLAALSFVVLTPIIPPTPAPLWIAASALSLALFQMARKWSAALAHAAVVLPALFLFFLCCHVRFAPWAWDNTKLMLWAYLLVLPSLWELVLARWRLWARALACELLFFSGFVSLLGGLRGEGYPIAKLAPLDAVADAVSGLAITDTFAAAPTYDHPLLLNGRKLALGYIGHLQSHALHYQPQLRILESLMDGADSWRQDAAELGVRYLYFGPRERMQWPQSRQPWVFSSKRIAAGEWGELYDLDTPRLPVEDL